MRSCRCKRRVKAIVSLLMIAAIGVCIACYCKKSFEPVFLEASRATVNVLAVEALNSAAKIATEKEYSDFFTFETSGNTKVLKSNSLLINKLTRQISEKAQEELNKINNKNLSIPLGTLTGITMLTGRGPDVSIKIMPIGAASCEFNSAFEDAGVNQTKHSLYLNLTCDIQIITTLTDVEVTAGTKVLICENVVVGDVPETYVNVDMLDLLP